MGCNGHFPKKDLLRVVKSPDGEISLDFTGKKSGRGAYICQSPVCLAKAERSKRLSRALSSEIPAEVFAAMHDELSAVGEKAYRPRV